MHAMTCSDCPPLPAALQRAHRILREASHAAAVTAVTPTRLAWLSNNKRPSPFLTSLIRPTKACAY